MAILSVWRSAFAKSIEHFRKSRQAHARTSMALVNVTNVIVLDNPTVFTNPFQFEVTLPHRLIPASPLPHPAAALVACSRWSSSVWASWRTTWSGRSLTWDQQRTLMPTRYASPARCAAAPRESRTTRRAARSGKRFSATLAPPRLRPRARPRSHPLDWSVGRPPLRIAGT